MQLGLLPGIKCSSRAQWLDECQRYFRLFQGLVEHKFVTWHKLKYIKDANGRPCGCVLVVKQEDGQIVAGASYCGGKDQHRFSRVEARARALASRQNLYGAYATDFYFQNNLWLSNFPASCRKELHNVICELLCPQPKEAVPHVE